MFEFKLNYNKALNAVDSDMVHLINGKLKEWNANPELIPKVALMSGTGGKAFCAGGDVVSIYNSKTGKEGCDPTLKDKFWA